VTPARFDFKHAAVPGRTKDGVLLPKRPGGWDYWFPRGRVHLIAGSSGAGKSTTMLDLLQAQAERHECFGHQTAGLRYLVIFADRGKLANTETLERMGLDPDAIPMEHMPVITGAEGVDRILDFIEAQPALPEVVFVEAADALVHRPSESTDVVPFLSDLQQIAEHYHISIILSVGCPKQKADNEYALVRDKVLGSEKWGRMSDTVALVMFTEDDSTRRLVVMHRQTRPETFALIFKRGRLVEALETVIAPIPDGVKLSASERDVADWSARSGVEWFTCGRLRKQSQFKKLSGETGGALLAALVSKGVLEKRQKPGSTPTEYRRVRQQAGEAAAA
jgi:hypothetical protein